jgi:hypothetical protein
MFGRKSKKSRERFYLLPGQGGENFHRKQRVIMGWTVAAAVLFGAVLTAVMWWLSRPKL